jgi:hypothetical protein
MRNVKFIHAVNSSHHFHFLEPAIKAHTPENSTLPLPLPVALNTHTVLTDSPPQYSYESPLPQSPQQPLHPH